MAVGNTSDTYKNGYTAEQVVGAIKGSDGFVTTIAKRLGCSRTYVYTLLKKFVSAQDALNDEREGNKDHVEGKLMELINDKNPTAIIFYLKTQAKDRGYIERQEIEVDANQDVKDWFKAQNEALRNG